MTGPFIQHKIDYTNPPYPRHLPLRANRTTGWWVSAGRYNALVDAYNELRDDVDQILRGGQPTP